MGKSLLARHLCSERERLIIVDTFAEKTHYGAGVIFYDAAELMDFVQARPRFRVIYRPLNVLSDPETDETNWLFYHCLAQQNVTLLIEEVSQFCSAHQMSEGFETLIRMHRHRAVTLVCTTQRPADVHKLLVSQSVLKMGRQFETNDIRYIKPFFPDADALLTLPSPVRTENQITVAFMDSRSHAIEVYGVQLPQSYFQDAASGRGVSK